jgi:DNA polymerase III subunit delta'
LLFKDIPGLLSLKHTLVQAVQQRHVAHAQLFCGPPGSGNLALALALATYLNCEDRQANDACGRCGSCLKMNRLVHPDVHLIFPLLAAKDELPVLLPRWREFVLDNPYQTLSDWLGFAGASKNQQGIIPIKEAHGIVGKLSLKAFEGEYKILILWQPELMNVESANALLKVLEEPPPNTIFLLVCHDANRLLATIVSRTQRVSVPAFEASEIVEYLTKTQSVEANQAHQIAYLADGNLAQALQLATGEPNDQHVQFADWMRLCFKADLPALVALAEHLDAQSKDTQKSLLEYGLNIMREVFLWQNQAGELVRLNGEAMTFVQRFADHLKPQHIENISQALSQAHYHLERNVRAKIVLLDLSLSFVRWLRS